MSSPVNTTQETAARGSYISVAASITARFKCCYSIAGNVETNTHAKNTVPGTTSPDPIPTEPEEDLPVTVDVSE